MMEANVNPFSPASFPNPICTPLVRPTVKPHFSNDELSKIVEAAKEKYNAECIALMGYMNWWSELKRTGTYPVKS